ncbi:MAG: hypothetical protein GWP91_09415 [Rhodobacterales bacterium]|nr:hypothetical protein [Rhodobacterales bacterium]
MIRTSGTFVLMVCGLLAAASPTAVLAEGGDSVESAANPASPEAMLGDAKATIAFVQDGLRRAGKVREKADSDNDDKLSDCIAPPYSSLRTLERVATARLDEMQTLISQQQVAHAGRVARSFVVLRDKASNFIAQAEACTADGKAQEGSSTVNSNVDAISDDDDTSPLLGDVVVDIDPPSISPFD